MQTLKQVIEEAEAKGVAVGHFNVSDTEGLWAVFNAARKLARPDGRAGLPIIIGVSEGERDFIGVKQIVALVKSLREEYDYPIFLNADHTYGFDRVKEVVDAGFDSVIFDGAELSLEENIKITKQCVDYARAKNQDILIEAELGFIGKSSKVLDEIPVGVTSEESMTKPEEAAEFVKQTGVDLLAPAVGNMHGMVKNAPNPKLDIERIKIIKKAVNLPLVLHGGSGISDADFRAAIGAGISVIHINTELRLAYKTGLKKSLTDNPDEVAPYKFMKEALLEMEAIVTRRLKLFNELS